MTHILVTGGAGTLGRQLVAALVQGGFTVRIMSRRSQPAVLTAHTEWATADLETGQGIAEAVQGVEVIVHLASQPARHTEAVDVRGTQRLLAEAHTARVRHFIYVSIVGIDRIPYGYYQHKLAAEGLVKAAGLPWSILRATQFHDFFDTILQAAARLPLILPLPTNWQAQLVDSGEVAEQLAAIVRSGPGGQLPDMGGPEVKTMGEYARAWLNIRGLKRLVIPLPLGGALAKGFREAANTCPQPEHRLGKITWAAWVNRKYHRTA
jgi:uncharacterized protein YbjT (DUF2867 family)